MVFYRSRQETAQLAAVAQLDRVFGYEPKGRGFESLQPYQKRSSPFGELRFCFITFASCFKVFSSNIAITLHRIIIFSDSFSRIFISRNGIFWPVPIDSRNVRMVLSNQ